MASTKKKSGGGGGGASSLRNIVTTAAATETIIDLVSRLGIVDLVVGRLKAKMEDTDIDDLFEEIADYLKRNPEVLVVSLGALTVATGLLVFLNSRREWDGTERRDADDDDEKPRTTSSTGRVRRSTAASQE